MESILDPEQVAGDLVRAAQGLARLAGRQQTLVHAVLVVQEPLRPPTAPGVQADAACILLWYLGCIRLCF